MPQPEMTFGATVVKQSNDHKDILQSLPSLTPAITQDSIAPSYADQPIPPCSPFYQHPPASHERVPKTLPSKSLDISVAEKGLRFDDMTPISVADNNPFSSSISVDANKECTMWPSRQTLATTKLVDKKNKRSARFCACAGLRHSWEGLHKDHRLAIRIIAALLIVGAMIGLGVGISKAVHGSYYSGNGNSMST